MMEQQEEEDYIQIKQEQAKLHYEQLKYYCLNPFCRFPVDRIFTSQSLHFKECICEDWILSHSELFELPEKQKNFKVDDLFLQFRRRPIKNILKSANIRDALQNRLKLFLEQTKKSFIQSLDIVENILKLKINQVVDPCKNIIKNIKQTITSVNYSNNNLSLQMMSYRLQQLIRNSHLKQFCEVEPTVIFPSEQIKQYITLIQKNIQQLIQKCICTKQQFDSDIALSSTEANKVIGYICQQVDDHQRMIQKYTTLLKVHPKKIYQKNTKTRQYIGKCPFCNFTASNQFGKGRNQGDIWEPISKHLVNEHFDVLTSYYSHNISKKVIKQISIPEALYLLREYSYKTVHLVFKAGRKFFDSNVRLHTDLVLEVICQKSNQTPLNQHRYVNMSDYSQFSMLLSLIGFTVKQKTCNKLQIYIYTSKAFTQKWKCQLSKFGFPNMKYIDEAQFNSQVTLSQIFKNESSIKGDDENELVSNPDGTFNQQLLA